ncbi:TM0106 family RecB-like putative nuclease [Saccharomonospora piscinae]|uniref:TM0106 family RecB-like putative nuclease n=1 Tax=Saccharomonospora piscinae TaxID=687388 RepID=UPI001106FE44|nr:TM0106 family RecB-like putative nuclease [Saccharomonospora piscinae]TLW93432.1 TM0106 family RecB-like putative nuclease [Saccharomonospora piscinae]
MAVEVLLDAGVVTRCRRRVHLDHEPIPRDVPLTPPDPAAEQRIADARTHRARISEWLRADTEGSWAVIPGELPAAERRRLTREALDDGVSYVWGALLPSDDEAGRRGGVELLVRASSGYAPVLVVRHRVTDPGQGARTTVLPTVDPDAAVVDTTRRPRSQPRDQLRLAHARRLLQAAGYAEPHRAVGGVVGLDADVVVWHDLTAPTWPGHRSALREYDDRFADRLAVARAAATRAEALAVPSRILECKRCPWWPVCEAELRQARDVSLVVRGEDAVELRNAGISTVDKLAALDPAEESPIQWTGAPFADAVALARAWLADLTVVRRVETVHVPRADVEVDIDMESFGDAGAYLWGCLLSGADIGVERGYRAFATWEPLPTDDEARSFARFWAWLTDVRERATAAGLSFRAYCYNALAENRWLYGSVERFAGRDGIPEREELRRFTESPEWVDLFRSVSEQFLCARGKGLKVVAPVAGFSWRDPEAGGEASMRWYRDAVGMDGGVPDPAQRERLLRYNEDDVRATYALRTWMSDEAGHAVPFMGQL